MDAHVGCNNHVLLPVEVLSKVLQQLDLQECLQSCSLVCSQWRKAAAMSITDIDVPHCDQVIATSLSAWLSTHAADAKLSSISVQDEDGDSSLILPLQQLTSLQTLQLNGVEARTAGADAWAGAQADAEGDTHAILVPAPLSLTRLDLVHCAVSLRGLHGLTWLQRLTVYPKLLTPAADDNVAQLQQAVPLLTQLTALHLYNTAATSATLAHLSNLTDLQELVLLEAGRSITEAVFTELPRGLTRLVFSIDFDLHDAGPPFHFSPSSTPGLCQLTALKELEIHGASSDTYFFHTGTLPTISALRKLSLAFCTMAAGNTEPTLSVLTALTQLEHLELPFDIDDGALVSPADYAALTASQQLTHLDLDLSNGLEPEHAAAVFHDALRLPKLAFLSLHIEWLEETETIQRVVDSCPGLCELHIKGTGGHDIAAIRAGRWAASLRCLTSLGSLTKLEMMTLDVAMGPEVFRALGALTGLQDLFLDGMDPNQLGAAVYLASCRQLTKLMIRVVTMQQNEHELSINATNQAPRGSPSDLWRQIPSLVLQAASVYMETGEGRSEAVKSLLRAAAQASNAALKRASELEARVGGLEQQVEQLQASMTAVLQRLQLPAAQHG